MFTARYERNHMQFRSIQAVKNVVPLGLTIHKYIIKTLSYQDQFLVEIKIGDIRSRNNITTRPPDRYYEMKCKILCCTGLSGIEIHYREAQPYPETGRRGTDAWMRLCLRGKRMNINGVSMLTAAGFRVQSSSSPQLHPNSH